MLRSEPFMRVVFYRRRDSRERERENVTSQIKLRQMRLSERFRTKSCNSALSWVKRLLLRVQLVMTSNIKFPTVHMMSPIFFSPELLVKMQKHFSFYFSKQINLFPVMSVFVVVPFKASDNNRTEVQLSLLQLENI